jgi:hypothetical protein
MKTRMACALVASAVLTGAAALAQDSNQTSREIEVDDSPITVVGCVQREADYRKMNDAGRGGVLATGIGRGNEYVLVDSAGDCGTLAPGAAAYELTGSGEKELAEFVGRRVEIAGTLKGGDLTVDGRAEGGFDPIGQDLRLREVEIASFRESGVTFAQNDSSIGVADADAVPVGTSGEQEAVDDSLPRTASPLALVGLLGLLSAGGGLGLRKVRNLIGR